MILKNYLLLIFILFLINGCSSFNLKENIVHLKLLSKVDNQITPKKIWHRKIGNVSGDFYSNLHPACKDNIVYVANRFGIVKAFDLISGKEKWKIDLSKRNKLLANNQSELLSGGITVDGNQIYIGSELGTIYSLKTDNGSIIWKTQVIGEILSSPVFNNNLVFVHTSNGFLQGIDKNNGQIKWSIELGNDLLSTRDISTPTVVSDYLIVGDSQGKVSSISIKKNQIIWKQDVSNTNIISLSAQLKDVNTTPIIFKGVIYVSSYNGNITALDLHSGEILWQRNIGMIKKLTADNYHIYAVDGNDNLISLNTSNGKIIWSQNNLLHRQLTSPIIYQNNLVIADIKGYLHWVNINNGKIITSYKLSNSEFQSEPIIAYDRIIIQSKNSYVYIVSV
ncbi:outer membrane protein assembly factor BamB [Candidatus Pantoea edessiphila]|uniref:Outer membrane protein assembly factor BamB n=1 Tax=Candidatus Pantoea edessiphila TaxID=2044610 RepID=A0A2P5T0Z1_9GAMM|nr:outer membrane protein assembly factor BamB [Candidatus Pantoea edessiphila]PPI88259.1 outer membrane protein assembly factor BamB [Candidatus Pantoea edessiphila]